MMALEQYKKAFLSLPEGIREAEVNGETHDAVSVSVSENELLNVQVSMEKALYIRVSGEKTGYYYTQNLEEDPTEALKTAYANSIYSERTIPEEMNEMPGERVQEEMEAEKDVDVLKSTAFELLQKMKHMMSIPEGTVSLMGTLRAETYGQHTVNSHGVDVCFTHPVYLFDVDAVVSMGEKSFTADISLAAMDWKELEIEKAAAELLLRCEAGFLRPASIAPGEYPVILSNSAVYYMMGTAWQLFSGCKYAEGTTGLTGMLGTEIGAECLTIVDKVFEDAKGFPMYYDSEGVKGEEVLLLDHGVFTGLLHNTASARMLGQVSTGNAGRRPLLFGNIATDILVTPKNICIKPGESSLDDMIEHMKNGILITEAFDIFHTIDISSGEFSIPCCGIKIEDGRAAGYLPSLMMTGNMRDLFRNVKEVGAHAMIHPMVAIQNYGIGTCPLRIESMTVSG